MTEMKRATISIPRDIDRKVFELRKDDAYTRCSYSELIRQLVVIGLEALAAEKEEKGGSEHEETDPENCRG